MASLASLTHQSVGDKAMIFKGEKAKKICHAIQKSFDDAHDDHCRLYAQGIKTTFNQRYSPLGKGYFKDGTTWVAFDNSTGEFWIEEFKSKKKAKRWIKKS